MTICSGGGGSGVGSAGGGGGGGGDGGRGAGKGNVVMVVVSQIPQVEQIGFSAVRKIYPHLHRKKLITKFLQLEDQCIEVIIKNKIGKDIANPHRRSRGAQLASVVDTAGHHPGTGFRLFGGGRKNKLMHIWARVKA